jgi:Tol biopolymer transport system component
MNTRGSTGKSFVVTTIRCMALAAIVAVTYARVTSGTSVGRIAFVGNQTGSFQLYTMDPDGTDMVQITNLAPTPFETWAPDFSPDGRKIVFCYGAVDSSGNLFTEIYAIKVDGTGLSQLTHDGQFDCFPRWSPDGTRIVFGRAVALTQQLVTATMAADGSDIKDLTTPFWGVARSGYTRDGQHILWETQQAGFVSVIWTMDSQGGQQKQLTLPPLRAGEISAPSPDGKHITFISNQNTPPALANSLFVMNLDGTDIRQITEPVGTSHDVYPNYSPDGTKIVFASDRMSSDGSLDIFTMNADGSSLTRIAAGVTVGGCADLNCVTPAWGRKP